MSTDGSPPWIDDRHVFHAGELVGTLLCAGFTARPVCNEEGIVTPVVGIEKDGQVWAVIVMPEGSIEAHVDE